MTLTKKPHPDLFEMEGKHGNIFDLPFKASFVHDDVDAKCWNEECMNPAHHRLLNISTGKEVTDTFLRIDAMRELWHGSAEGLPK